VKKGDTITFHAYRTKDGTNFASARWVTLANGRTMVISDAQEDGGPAADAPTTGLPSTASNVPLVGLVGLLALFGAFTARRFARVS
jgi:LPXTG-motif cell wall-anchored protein